ncbi:MAG: hypothetical protein ACLVGQ_11845 [Blautia massiliensis (ex Durand et al. 2017)]|uniref:hypothetical protein n=1 Tax=Blautia massiliensis (ex Durand et al. 2017) TaxID=1737424 RepID=UPI00399C752E
MRLLPCRQYQRTEKVCGDDFYAVEIHYKSPTCSAIFAAFDWYMNGSNVDTEHRTLTADGCFAQCEDLEDVEAVNFPWPDPELYIDPEECRRLVDEAPDDKVVMGMLWACHFQDTCAAFGMQTCLMNMVAEPEMVHYVDDHIVDFYLKALKIFLEATKGKVQAILIGDDVGSQERPDDQPGSYQRVRYSRSKETYRSGTQLWRKGCISFLRIYC